MASISVSASNGLRKYPRGSEAPTWTAVARGDSTPEDAGPDMTEPIPPDREPNDHELAVAQ